MVRLGAPPRRSPASQLGLSINTVRTHVSSMLAKLALPDRRALAAWEGTPADAAERPAKRFFGLAMLGSLAEGLRPRKLALGLKAAAGLAVGVVAIAVAVVGDGSNDAGPSSAAVEWAL